MTTTENVYTSDSSMRPFRSCTTTIAITLATITVLVLQQTGAQASPFEDTRFGAQPFTGPTQPHASSLYINPAAMSQISSGKHIFFDSTLHLDRVVVARNRLNPTTFEPEPGAQVRDITLTPTGMFAFSWRNDKTTVGLFTLAPHAQRFTNAGDELGFHTQGGHHYQVTLGAISIAYQPISWLSFGATLSFGNARKLRMRFYRDTALAAGSAGIASDCGGEVCGLENPAARQRITVNVGDEGLREGSPWKLFRDTLLSFEKLSLSLGALVRINKKWWLGVSYQSSNGVLFNTRRTLIGEAQIVDPARDGGATFTGEARVQFDIPFTVNAGLRGPMPGLPGLELVADLQWQPWSYFQHMDIQLFGGDLDQAVDSPDWLRRYGGFQDTWRFQLGAEEQPGDRLRLGARLTLETATVDDNAIAPHQIDGLNIGGSVGAEIQLGRHWNLGVSYQLSYFPQNTTTDSAFSPADQVACVDSGFDFDSCEAARDGRGISTAQGSYNRQRHSLTVGFRRDFL